MTVLFADLCDFTAFAEQTDPEDVRALVDRCLHLMGEVVERFGGTVVNVMGDGIMALFGAPVAHEDDPERAVRAALELQQHALARAGDIGGFQLSIGINTGEVIFAPLGPDSRRDITALGDAANVASRLQAAAPPGGVVVGEQTYLASRSAVEYEPIEPLQLKGKRERLPAWRPVRVSGPPAPRPISTVALVGRKAEFDLLRSIWSRAVEEGQPHLVTVLGPPGIGKTRLGREFVGSIEAGGARALAGRSLPYGEQTGYGAFGQQLKQVAGIFETDPATVAREKLARAVAALVPGASVELPERLAVLAGLADDHVVSERGQLFVAARTFVEAVARDVPTVFVFEDIHWADASLCELIETLAATVRDAPAVFVALARPELLDARPQWGGGLTAYTAIPLSPLSSADAHTLATRLLHGREDSEVARVAGAAGGNPLFIEEFAASLSEGAAVTTGHIPLEVNAVISSRLDALPAPARRVVLDAAVVGKVFWRGALQHLGHDRDLDQALATLEVRDLIRRAPASRIVGDEEFTFKHMLIQEVAYATLSRAARSDRHGAVAGFIESAAGDRVAEWASVLAHHWKAAGEVASAVDYLLVSAHRARRAWAATEAASQYGAALELLPEDDVDRRRTIRLERALALAHAGDHDAALPELQSLIPDLGGRDLVEALVVSGRSSFWLMDAQWTSEAGRRALALANDSSDAPDLRAPALALVARSKAMVERVDEGTADGEEALATWSTGTHTADLVFHLGQLGTEYAWVGRYARAAELAQRGFDLAMEAELVDGVFTGSALGMALTGLGRHDEAITFLERVVALGRELELVHAPRFTARALNMLAGALREVNDLERSRASNEEAMELGRRSGFLHPTVQGGIDRLYVDLGNDDPGRAQRAWPELWEQAHQVLGNFFPWLVQSRLVQAEADIALAVGDAEAALAAATTAMERARRPGRIKYEALAHLAAGTALRRMGKDGDALAHLRGAVVLAETMKHPPTLWRAHSSLGAARYATGDDAGADASYRRARDTIAAFAATLSPARRAIFLSGRAIADILVTG